MNNTDHHSDSKEFSKIEAYLADELSVKERYQLEKAMLDDPFLSDAVEGLAMITDKEKRKAALTGIRKSLGSKKPKEKSFIYYKSYAAAAVLVIMSGMGYFLIGYLLESPNNEEALSEIRKIETKEPTPESDSFEENLVQDEEVLSTKDTESALSEINAEQAVKEESTVGDKAIQEEVPSARSNQKNSLSTPRTFQQDVSSSQQLLKKEELGKNKAELADNTVVEEQIESREESLWDNGFEVEDDFVETNELFLDSSASVSKSRYALKENKKQEAQRLAKLRKNRVGQQRLETYDVKQRVIKGFVTDVDKKPLPGVNINLKGTAIGTITDIDGQFLLTASADNQLLTINYVGFENEEIPLEAGDNEVKITLDEDTESLSELVVTGYSKVKQDKYPTGSVTTLDRQDLGLPVMVTYPSPLGGMKAFKEYIDTNLVYPQQANEAGISGHVKLGFTITIEGKVKDVEVIRSLGFGCDEEAIRLLRNGPDWYPKTVEDVPEESQRTIKVKFK